MGSIELENIVLERINFKITNNETKFTTTPIYSFYNLLEL